MQGLTALLVLALDAAGAHAAPFPDLRVAAIAAAAGELAPTPAVAAAAPADARHPPACLGDVCQPQVSVPGYDPRYSLRGLRTQLTVQALDRLRIEPVASAVWWLAATGVRLDYTPAALDAAANGGGRGVAHLEILLRWRMDAFGEPAWMARRPVRPSPGARPPAP